jgi:UDP-N-acetylmuramate: L-alanyl-gamma-D-glutamyl-meso-diaminopimelate ligase
LANLSAAKAVCNRLGVTDKMFYSAIQSFVGAGKRLELMGEKAGVKVFKDFAHAPSKLAASINAVKEQFASKEVVAVYELHTFSSFNDEFLAQYKDALQDANLAILLLDDKVLEAKGKTNMTDEVLKAKFNAPDATVIHNQEQFVSTLKSIDWNNKVLLVMSSGGLTGLSFDDIIEII